MYAVGEAARLLMLGSDGLAGGRDGVEGGPVFEATVIRRQQRAATPAAAASQAHVHV